MAAMFSRSGMRQTSKACLWKIDGIDCITKPPDIRFNDMPTEVTMVVARLCSHPPGPYSLAYSEPCLDEFAFWYPALHHFAYQGNVDIGACKCVHLGTAQ